MTTRGTGSIVRPARLEWSAPVVSVRCVVSIIIYSARVRVVGFGMYLDRYGPFDTWSSMRKVAISIHTQTQGRRSHLRRIIKLVQDLRTMPVHLHRRELTYIALRCPRNESAARILR